MYEEIQREAGEQAKKALKIRNDYVKAAQEAGIANAKGASAPYKKGAQTAVNTAGPKGNAACSCTFLCSGRFQRLELSSGWASCNQDRSFEFGAHPGNLLYM